MNWRFARANLESEIISEKPSLEGRNIPEKSSSEVKAQITKGCARTEFSVDETKNDIMQSEGQTPYIELEESSEPSESDGPTMTQNEAEMPQSFGDSQESQIDVKENAAISDTVFDSLYELSSALGFSVKELRQLPFEVISISYSRLDDSAELVYQGEEQRVVFVQTKESFPTMDQDEVIEVDGVSVYLKKRRGIYSSAQWRDEEYSYTLYMDMEYGEDEIRLMVAGGL